MAMAKLPIAKTLKKGVNSLKKQPAAMPAKIKISNAIPKKAKAIDTKSTKSFKSITTDAKEKKPKQAAREITKVKTFNKQTADFSASSNAAAALSKKQKKKQKNGDSKQNTKIVAVAVTKPQLSKMQQKIANKKLHHKQQKLKRKLGKLKQKNPVEKLYEPVAFDEDKFDAIVNAESVRKIVEAWQAVIGKELSEKKNAIFNEYRCLLNVASFKIPSCPKRMVKLNLQHSLVDENDDIVIIVPDLQSGSKVDYEPTIQHYEDRFRAAGVRSLKVMPFNQLRKEYNTFEAVRKLANTYDYFLCDGRLVGRVAGFCGKIFQGHRTTFHSVRLEHEKNYKCEIDKSLRRTCFKQLHKGNLISIPFGTHKFNAEQLTENALFLIEQLKKLYPGGMANVRNMHLKIDIIGTSSMPIYMSMAEPPEETPYVVGPREKRMLSLKKEANEVLAKFSISKDANILKLTASQVKRKRKIREAHAALVDYEQPPTDNEESGVPAKRARKDDPKDDKNASSGKDDNDDEDSHEGEEDTDDSGDDYPDEDDGDDDENDEIDDDEDDDDEEDVEEEEDDQDANVITAGSSNDASNLSIEEEDDVDDNEDEEDEDDDEEDENE